MKSLTTRFSAALAALFLSAGAPGNLLRAVDYYVSNGGSDVNTGLSSGAAFRTITHALTVAGAGDRVLVEPGVYDDTPGPGQEIFPLVVPEGLTLEGTVPGGASLDASGAGAPCLQVNAGTLPTAIRNLRLLAPTTAASTGMAVFLAGRHANLTVEGNTVVSAYAGVASTTSLAGGPVGMVLRGNTITAFLGIRLGLSPAAPETHAADVSGNVISATGTGIRVTGTGPGTLDLLVQGNQVTGPGAAGVSASFTSAAAVLLDVLSNEVGSFTATGIRVRAGRLLAGSALMTLDLSGNTVSSCGVGARLLAVGNGATRVVSFGGTVECNDLLACSSTGMALSASVLLSAADVTLDPLVRYNRIAGGGGVGLLLVARADFGAMADNLPVLRGNVVTGQAGDGVFLSWFEANGANAALDPDFGAAAFPDRGRNSFTGNGSFEFNAAGLADSAFLADCEGNWWNDVSSTGVAADVNDNADSSGLATVDYSPFLVFPLSFTAAPGSLPGGVPAVVTVTADPDTPFVRKAGSLSLAATLGGLPVPGVAVAADGATLSFTAPAGLPAGPATLVITNPGGQTGSIVLLVLDDGDGNGGCFVATAAFGDREAAEVRLLRRWRDECLATNPLGRQLVRAYYAASPALARAIAERPLLRTASRAALVPVAGAVRLGMELPWVYGLLLGGWLLWRSRRR